MAHWLWTGRIWNVLLGLVIVLVIAALLIR